MKKNILVIGLISFSSLALAQHKRNHNSHNDSLRIHQIEDIQLHKHGNPNKATVLTSKGNLSIMETPQPIAIVTHEIIEQQQMKQLSDVVQNVNGMYVSSARGGAQDSFGGRGFLFGSDNMFKNGARVNSGVFPEVQGLERVEVLKGGNAMQFGASSAGAIMNMVTKKPRFYFGGSVGTHFGSWDNVKPFVDVYGPLSKNVAFRINGTYEHANSFRDVVNSQKHYFNPSFVFNLSPNTQLIVEADYLKHRSTPDFGIGSITKRDKSFAINDRVPINTFFGANWQYQDVQQLTSNVTLNTKLAKNWTLNTVASFQNYTRDYFSTERLQWEENAQGRFSWARPLGKTYSESNYASLQMNVNGEFNTGRIHHKVLIGADGDYTKSDAYSFSILDRTTQKPLANYGVLFLDDPKTWSAPQPDLDTKMTRKTSVPMYRGGVYFQDLVSITNSLKVLGGIRYNYIENRQTSTFNYANNTNDVKNGVENITRNFSPKVGLIYQVDDNFSFFGNYTNSFALNTGFTASPEAIASLNLSGTPAQVGTQINALPLQAIKPSQIDQYEVGVKKNFFKGALAVNLTAYQIINKDNYQNFWYTNAAGSVMTPTGNVTFRTYAGTIKSKGVELDITGNPTKQLSIMGGFSYNHAAYTNTPEDGFIEGQRLVRTPATTANASVFYAFNNLAKGFKLGASFYYMADRLAGWNDSKMTLNQRANVTRVMKLDDYYTLALSAGYEWRKFIIQAKVNNVTNSKAFIVHENYSVNPLAPRNYYVTLTYKL